MAEPIIVATGNGYQGCTAFDGFTVIAEPLPTRESRSFPRRDGAPGVTYASHSIKLAKRNDYWNRDRDLFILLEHGGGRRVIRYSPCYDNGAAEAALLALPEAVLYSVLYGIATGAEQADRYARQETAQEYAQAFIEGRLKKSRPRQGRRTVSIEPKAATPSEEV